MSAGAVWQFIQSTDDEHVDKGVHGLGMSRGGQHTTPCTEGVGRTFEADAIQARIKGDGAFLHETTDDVVGDGSSSASRIFSHAEARRARREEDWIFSACSAAPREPLYSPSSKLGKLKVVIRKTGVGGPGSADVIVGRCERIDSNPVPRYSAAANSSMLAQVNEVR